MPSETIEQRAKRSATKLRVERYLRDIGRPDVLPKLPLVLFREGTVAEVAMHAIALGGPPPGVKEKLEAEIKMMLHASRDCLRTKYHSALDRGFTGSQPQSAYDPKKVRFVASDGYYGEAFGIVRACHVLGWGEYGAVNVEGTLQFWFQRLEDDVLHEENFGGSGECDICLKRYGKDDAGRTR